jgi:UDP-GlcNAc:undecaprenyl-phosphate GlcNAc-1-phosphate transferase
MMDLPISLLLALLLMGACIGLVVGVWARPLGEAFALLDHPDHHGGRKLHVDVTPLVGGFAVVTAALLGIAVLAVLHGSAGGSLKAHFWFAFTVLAMFLIGVLDDRSDISAPARLGLTSVVLLLPIMLVPEFFVGHLHFALGNVELLFPGLVGVAFTLLCLVGLLNAVNMADGKNGLVIGQALIWTVALAYRLPESFMPLMVVLFAVLAVLMVFNMRGRLFLGDGGSYAISATYGLLAILAWNLGGGSTFFAGDIVVIFALPVIDTLRLIAHRTLKGVSPFSPGRDHFHHYLFSRWGWPGPLPFVLGLVALTNLGALIMPGTGLFWAGVTLVGYCLLLLASIRVPAGVRAGS